LLREKRITPALYCDVLITNVRKALLGSPDESHDVAAFFSSLLDFPETLDIDTQMCAKVVQELAKDFEKVLSPPTVLCDSAIQLSSFFFSFQNHCHCFSPPRIFLRSSIRKRLSKTPTMEGCQFFITKFASFFSVAGVTFSEQSFLSSQAMLSVNFQVLLLNDKERIFAIPCLLGWTDTRGLCKTRPFLKPSRLYSLKTLQQDSKEPVCPIFSRFWRIFVTFKPYLRFSFLPAPFFFFFVISYFTQKNLWLAALENSG